MPILRIPNCTCNAIEVLISTLFYECHNEFYVGVIVQIECCFWLRVYAEEAENKLILDPSGSGMYAVLSHNPFQIDRYFKTIINVILMLNLLLN